MNILNLPYSVYMFPNYGDVGVPIKNFFEKLLIDYNNLYDNLYVKEIYGLKNDDTDILMDISILLNQLIRIQLAIYQTDDPKTYNEYIQDYHIDCIFKKLICKGVNIKELMKAFDSGYANINNIPEIYGIGSMIIEDTFIID